MSIDPYDIARFMVLEGASELIEAFSRIPAGPVRQSLITHAQHLAGAYSAAPPSQSAPDPLLGLQRHVGMPTVTPPKPAAKAIEAPKTKDGLKATTPEGRAVERRIRGEKPKEIAEKEGLPMWKVTKLFQEARQAGVAFPVLRRIDVPQDEKEKKGFPLSEDELNGQGRARAESAARDRGLTMDGYMARRRMFLGMAKDGEPRAKIAEACREEPKVISGWFSHARAAGLLPAWDEEFRKERERVSS